MVLENKLGITSQIELASAEEKISKQKARQLFETGDREYGGAPMQPQGRCLSCPVCGIYIAAEVVK